MSERMVQFPESLIWALIEKAQEGHKHELSETIEARAWLAKEPEQRTIGGKRYLGNMMPTDQEIAYQAALKSLQERSLTDTMRYAMEQQPEPELDPQPWFAQAPEGKRLMGPTRFNNRKFAYKTPGLVIWQPRPGYAQDPQAYPENVTKEYP